MLVFDIESDGLLDTITKVHCINLIDRSTGREYRYTDHEFYQDVDGSYTDEPTPRDGTISDGLDKLAGAECIGGQNIIGYDVPALRVVHPEWRTKALRRDTQVKSRVMYTNIKKRDFAALRKGRLPGRFQSKGLIGLHSLEAWGIRIGGDHQKADFKPGNYKNPKTGEKHTWATIPFIKDMDDYCMDDVRTNVLIFEHFESKEYAEECLSIEHDVARIIQRQVQVGFEFDEKHALSLVSKYQQQQAEMDEQLRDIFQPWYTWDGKDKGRTVPKRTMKRWIDHPLGAHTRKMKGEERVGFYQYREEGGEFSKIKLVVFNPGSRDQIANRLQVVHGWEPSEYTSEGKPSIDESILEALPYPEAKELVKYFVVKKRLGQIADGKKSWLKFLKGSRVHGKVNSNGAVTGRMTHYAPNVGQVDGAKEMRECWTVRKGYKLLGCDADGIQLRCLGHYMALFDEGAFAVSVVEGKKEDGTDAHSINQKLLQFNERDNAKTWIYAFLFGAQNYKLGTIVLDDFTDEKRERFYSRFPEGKKRQAAIARLGQKSRTRIAGGLPALGKLVAKVQNNCRRGYLKGLDGRHLHIRSAHAALNTLLQGAEAVLMKKALVMLDDELQSRGFTCTEQDPNNYDYEFVANVHDEFQMEVKEQHAEEIGRLAADAIRKAGEYFNFRCPLAGAYDIGSNWSETH